jgi:hypothetical protein
VLKNSSVKVPGPGRSRDLLGLGVFCFEERKVHKQKKEVQRNVEHLVCSAGWPQENQKKRRRCMRRTRCMKRCFLIIILLALSVGFASIDAKASMTIATFDDLSTGSSEPLFKVDFTQTKLTGGWADTNTGLTLQIPYSGNTFTNAWFKMTVVEINAFGDTRGGEINFYKDGDSTSPLLAIKFESGFVSRYGFGADEIFVADNVTITGSEITGTLSEEQFAFSFANLAKLPGHSSWDDGFTATAAFTSSAVVVSPEIPEPATIGLLGLGTLSLVRGKRCVEFVPMS